MKFPVTKKKEEALLARMHSLNIRESDLDEQFVSAQGPGGQHVNRRATCVILTHRPSGIHVRWQTERSQGLNRFFARRRLMEEYEKRILGIRTDTEKERERIKKQKKRRKRRRKASPDY